MYTRKQAEFYRNIINGNIRSFYDPRRDRDIIIDSVNANAKTALCETIETWFDEDEVLEFETVDHQNFTFDELSHFEIRG